MVLIMDNKLLASHTFEIYKLESANKGKEVSAYVTTLVHYAIENEDILFLNKLFNVLDKSKLTSWSLIALLRTTSVYKKDILLWKDFYLFTKQIVSEEGLNVKQHLHGLDKGLNLL